MSSEGTRTGPSHFMLNALRIATGALFWFHGAQKLFAMFGRDQAAEFPSQIWWAGFLEFAGGILVALGLFTRPVAFVLAGEMAIAYVQAHAPRAIWPVMNNGELALLYLFVFLFLAANGGGSFSVDGALKARTRGKLAE